MNLTELFIRRPVLASVISLMILVLGSADRLILQDIIVAENVNVVTETI